MEPDKESKLMAKDSDDLMVEDLMYSTPVDEEIKETNLDK